MDNSKACAVATNSFPESDFLANTKFQLALTNNEL